jgi:hypothetical protein
MAAMEKLVPVQEKLPAWARVLVAMLLVIGLLTFVRGRDHHHSDDVGALGSRVTAEGFGPTSMGIAVI